MNQRFDPKDVQKTIPTESGKAAFFQLSGITGWGLPDPQRLPFSIKILLESALRNFDNYQITSQDIQRIARWQPDSSEAVEIGFKPGRVILQDFTGVPCVVDLAAMRSAMQRLGGDYRRINPQVPCDLVIDHSVQVDAFGTSDAFAINMAKEFERNTERYEFLKWGQKALQNFRVVPPGTGIVHQVNLEYLATGVMQQKKGDSVIVYPDSLVGTDSHTTMINGLGIVGWGVGGIEAEAVMLGEPIYMLLPKVVGFRLTGRLPEGVTATDLVLTVTQILRKKGVVNKFVEFYGDGVQHLSLPDRATISNMAPEYGATIGLFPVDQETLNYYRITGRSDRRVDLIERYMKEQGMFYSPGNPDPEFSEVMELDLGKVEPSLAGPKRPQDRVALFRLKETFRKSLTTPPKEHGFGLEASAVQKTAVISNSRETKISHGAVAIAAITSCTNTSNPSVLVSAGLFAKKAVEKGLKIPEYVKTSFAPGSQVVDQYLRDAGLMPYLEKLGFHLVGYGCTTCIGNSGPLPENVAKAIREADLVAVSVLSGNRNFEGRINPLTKASFLTSPPLVVAYALAGRVDINLDKEPIGKDQQGKDVYLKDLWPGQDEVNAIVSRYVTAKAFREKYGNVTRGDHFWNEINVTGSDLYDWKEASTYIQEPPFFIGMKPEPAPIAGIKKARVLIMAGDSVTTDHISPAGSIAPESPAGHYLVQQGVPYKDFNSYGSRRGNDRVMTRGTFANIRFRNLLVPGTEGAWTVYWPTGDKLTIYDAAERYRSDRTPLVILAGQEYGTGSSRDWAAKGTALLGVKVVIAESYERIHRSNLVGMGVLPLQFAQRDSADALKLTGEETYDFRGISDRLKPGQEIHVTATGPKTKVEFTAICRLDTKVEIDYYRHGGILPMVVRKLLKKVS